MLRTADIPALSEMRAGVDRVKALKPPAESHVAETRGAAAVIPLVAAPYRWVEPAQVPRRDWLFKRHYARGFLSATVGAGAAGKSSRSKMDQISMVIGRNLDTGEPIPGGPLRVWALDLEDPMEEAQRRIQAVCLRYRVTAADIGGRLFLNSGRDRSIKVASETRDGLVLSSADIEALKAQLIAHRIDVLIIDPYVASHAIGENDNTKQDAVAQVWRSIATDCNVSVEALHHVRKANGQELTIDDVRGAGAFVNAARSVRLLSTMSPEDARKFGISEERRRFYTWLNPHAKANMAPPVNVREWYESESVELGNGDGVRPGDSIGVSVRWSPPDAMDDVTAADVLKLQAELRAMPLDRLQDECRVYRNSNGWIGRIVGRLMDIDVTDDQGRSQIERIVSEWARCGILRRAEFKDTKGKTRPYYTLGGS